VLLGRLRHGETSVRVPRCGDPSIVERIEQMRIRKGVLVNNFINWNRSGQTERKQSSIKTARSTSEKAANLGYLKTMGIEKKGRWAGLLAVDREKGGRPKAKSDTFRSLECNVTRGPP